MKAEHSDYRERIYRQYVGSFQHRIAPTTLADLRSRAPYLKQLIHRHFPENREAKILELGCGHGALIYCAQQAGYYNITGVDRSADQTAAAKHLGIQGVVEGDLLETLHNIPDDSYDVIIAFDVIEHFQKNEVIELVDEVFRVLKSGGEWIIHTTNAESPFYGRIRYGDFTHELCFTRQSIKQVLSTAGFSKVESSEDAPIPHGIKSVIRWVCWKGIRNILKSCVAVETGLWDKNSIFSQNFLTIGIK